MEPLDPIALSVAADRAGLSEDQMSAAIMAFRLASDALHSEPEWSGHTHITMRDCGISMWTAEGTGVTKQIQTPRTQDGWGVGVISFVYGDRHYETFGEARSVELRRQSAGGKVVSLAQGAPAAVRFPPPRGRK